MMNKMLEDQINQYFLGGLSPEDKVVFEEHLQNNSDFKKEVQLQNELAKAIHYKKNIELKTTVKNFTQDWQQYVPELNETKQNLIEATQQSVKNALEDLNNLVLQVFNPYSTAIRNKVVEQHSMEEQAFLYYNRKEYAKAITVLLKLPKDNQEVMLMIGNAYLAQQKYEAAYPYFKQLIDEEAIFFLSYAHWYAGLCLTGLNRIAEAQKHFQHLINDENTSKDLQQNALTLQRQLNPKE